MADISRDDLVKVINKRATISHAGSTSHLVVTDVGEQSVFVADCNGVHGIKISEIDSVSWDETKRCEIARPVESRRSAAIPPLMKTPDRIELADHQMFGSGN